MISLDSSPAPSFALLPGDSVEAFRALLVDSVRSLGAAAAMFRRLYKDDDSVMAELSTGPGAVPVSFLTDLLRVAEKSLHPAIILNDCSAYRALDHKPYDIQASVINQGVADVLTGEGERDFIRVDVVNLSDAQVKQVMSRSGLRTLDEQRAWLRARATATRVLLPADAGLPYEVTRKGLAIFRPCTLSRAALLGLLQEMDSK